MQLEIKMIRLLEDLDFVGQSEGLLYVAAGPCSNDNPDSCNPVTHAKISFQASADPTENVVFMNRVIPRTGDETNSGSPDLGIDVLHGQRFGFHIWLMDVDAFGQEEDVGGIAHTFGAEDNWGIGSHNELSKGTSSNPYLTSFEITYEIRHAPLPDLRLTGLKVIDTPGVGELVCADVWNAGKVDAGPFSVLFTGYTPETPFGLGDAEAGRLGSGATGQLCVNAMLPGSWNRITAQADAADKLPESNETNNSYEIGSTARQATTVGGSQTAGVEQPADVTSASPASTKPDLVVDSIRVKGGDPSGNNDCDPGNNQVEVIVKNKGKAAAGGFLIRLVIDNGSEPNREASIGGLAAGAEQTAGIGTVNLKKGQHSLTASVDAKNQVAESDEDDNKKSVNVTCKDEDD
jgi:hypothetical protein